MAQNNTIHNILEVVVGTADIRSSKKDLRHLRNLRDLFFVPQISQIHTDSWLDKILPALTSEAEQ